MTDMKSSGKIRLRMSIEAGSILSRCEVWENHDGDFFMPLLHIIGYFLLAMYKIPLYSFDKTNTPIWQGG